MMTIRSRRLAAPCLMLLLAAAAGSQELEPGVRTSSAAAPVNAPADASSRAPAAAVPPAPVKPTVAAAPAAAGAAPKGGKATDHIELGTTQISGNRELPKVMYVVPWRKADLGELAGRPPNSLLEEALTPVDRDVFRRQNDYYAQLAGQAAAAATRPGAAGAGSAPPRPGDEK